LENAITNKGFIQAESPGLDLGLFSTALCLFPLLNQFLHSSGSVSIAIRNIQCLSRKLSVRLRLLPGHTDKLHFPVSLAVWCDYVVTYSQWNMSRGEVYHVHGEWSAVLLCLGLRVSLDMRFSVLKSE
jgi:hypothetical protein